jgi:hypothetical protein
VIHEFYRDAKRFMAYILLCYTASKALKHSVSQAPENTVELASLGYPFLPLQLQPLVNSFYYWNILTYSRTNRLISIPIRLRLLNLHSRIDVVIVLLL